MDYTRLIVETCLFLSILSSSQPTVQYGGELILGDVDTQLFSGEISWAPVTREVYWQIGIEE